MTLQSAALARAIADARAWRLMLLAALDKLHEAQQDNAVQDKIIKRLREEIFERSTGERNPNARMGVPTNGAC